MLLVIDSATAACSVALIEGDRLVDERHELVGRGHAERLVPMIGEMLGGRRPRAILVDCGPGSFTGVRVGLAAAHGLAIGWEVPLSGYSSMALIAAGTGEDEIAVALHGGHGQLFVQSFGREPLMPLDELRSLLPDDAAAATSCTPRLWIGRRDAGERARLRRGA
jgi:tRNA threonylcarbamoyl adenosine modification protein YeaZ